MNQGCFCIRLTDGRRIRLESFHRSHTYECLGSGAPDRLTNFHVIQRLRRIGVCLMRASGEAPELALLPTSIWDLRSGLWEQTNWYRFQRPIRKPRRNPEQLISEWMPEVATVARFTSDPIFSTQGDYSALAVLWFQHSFDALMDEEALKALIGLSWDALGKDFQF